MDEKTFWALVEEAKAEMTPELSNQPAILKTKLKLLPLSDIVDFDRIFTKLHRDAYRWDLWAAAYIIEGGCSDAPNLALDLRNLRLHFRHVVRMQKRIVGGAL